jgi:HAMP domain-containing protein
MEKQQHSNLTKIHASTVDELERMKKSFGKTLNEQKQEILALEQSVREMTDKLRTI